MKFSIITPSFNQGRFLPDCIESVLTQTSVEVEHIVIDAGSTDETLEVLKSHPHLTWISEPDRGMSDGINKGFNMATGDWVMWLNCDDYLLPHTLKRVADFIHLNPQCDIVHGDCLFVNEDKSLIRRKYDHRVTSTLLVFVGCYIPSTSTFIKSTVIKAGHLLDIQYKVCMDWEYYLRLLREGFKFSYIPEAIAGFRWHGTNTSILQSKRREVEAMQLQREHLSINHFPGIFGSKHVLNLMRRLFQIIRVSKRFATHKRFF